MYLYLGITMGKYKTSMTHLGWPERKGGSQEHPRHVREV